MAFFSKGNKWELVIAPNGQYECVVSNPFGEVTRYTGSGAKQIWEKNRIWSQGF